MEIFGLHVPGTRDKDREIEQLQRALAETRIEAQKEFDRLNNDLLKTSRDLGWAQKERDEAHSQYDGLQERYVDASVEHETIKAELERLQELAPFQVRHWDLTVRKACTTLQEAIEEASRPGRPGNVYITKREGDHNRMMTAEEIREAVEGREQDPQHPCGEVMELEPPSPEAPHREPAAQELDDRDPAYRQCVAEDRADLAYELKEPSEEQLDRIQKAKERAEGRADDHDPEQTRQPSMPRRREQPQAPPPHILHRQAGMDRGLSR